MKFLPFNYAVRNLRRRPTSTLQLVLGSGVVVLMILVATSLNRGMSRVLIASGSADNVILLGAGSEESVERSEVAVNVTEIASAISGLRQVFGRPAVSPEAHYNGLVETAGGESRQALLRGVRAPALWVHRNVRVLEGRFPHPGEVMVGQLAHHKLEVDPEELTIGSTIRFNNADLRIAGRFDAPGTVMEAEIWMNLGDLMALTQRESLSCVVVCLDQATFEDVDVFTKQRLDLELVALTEKDYYKKLSSFYAPVRWMTWVSVLLMSAGAIFGGLNTLYAAFASRIQEFGALQAIGFTRGTLLFSLIQESLATTLTGALLAMILAVQLLDGFTVPFSIGAFRLEFDPDLLILAIGLSFGLGIFGALPPAWNCLGQGLARTLRAA